MTPGSSSMSRRSSITCPQNSDWSDVPDTHVVLYVPLVIGQVGVPVAFGRSQKDLQAGAMRAHSQPSADRRSGLILRQQRPLEFANERLTEAAHRVQHLLPCREVVVNG
jgi:hypothetical protein